MANNLLNTTGGALIFDMDACRMADAEVETTIDYVVVASSPDIAVGAVSALQDGESFAAAMQQHSASPVAVAARACSNCAAIAPAASPDPDAIGWKSAVLRYIYGALAVLAASICLFACCELHLRRSKQSKAVQQSKMHPIGGGGGGSGRIKNPMADRASDTVNNPMYASSGFEAVVED